MTAPLYTDDPAAGASTAPAAVRRLETNHAVAILVIASLGVLVATRRSFKRYIP